MSYLVPYKILGHHYGRLSPLDDLIVPIAYLSVLDQVTFKVHICD